MGSADMKEYKSYEENKMLGGDYEDFIRSVLKERYNYTLHPYTTEEGQYKYGENKEGIEIKNDLIMERTRRIWIEVAEKTNKDNLEFVPSGIYRGDNSRRYLIGNYQEIYIFKIEVLRQAYQNGDYYMLKANPTSKGFLLTIEQAERLAGTVIYPTQADWEQFLNVKR